MTWARLDDGFPENPKVAALSDGAFRAHVHGICYCARNLTDGFVPVKVGRSWGRAAMAELAATLWEPVAGGWQIHDYLDYNPPRAEVLAKRRAAAERMASVRANGQRTLREPTANLSQPRTRTRTPTPKPLAAVRPRDELFEVIVEVCGWSLDSLTRDARGRANGAAKQLREVGADPPLMRGFADLWAEKYPGAPLTPQALTGNWPDYMAGKLWPEIRRRR